MIRSITLFTTVCFLVIVGGCQESPLPPQATGGNQPGPGAVAPLPPAPPVIARPGKKAASETPAGNSKQKTPPDKSESEASDEAKNAAKETPVKKKPDKTRSPKPETPKVDPGIPPAGRRYALEDDRFGPDQPKVNISEYCLLPSWGRFLSDGRILLVAKVKSDASHAMGPCWFFFDPATGRVLDRIDVPAMGTRHIQSTPDASAAVTLSVESAYYYNLKRRAEAKEIASTKSAAKMSDKTRFSCAAISPDGDWIVLGGNAGAQLWSTKRQRTARSLEMEPVTAAAISSNNQFAALAGTKAITVWDLRTGRHDLCPNRSLFGSTAIAFMPDGQSILTATESLGTVRLLASCPMRVVHVTSGRVTVSFRAENPITCVAVSPDGKNIVSGDLTGNVVLWDARSGARTRVITRHAKRVQSIDISTDGSRVLSLGQEAVLAVTPLQDKGAKLRIDGREFQRSVATQLKK